MVKEARISKRSAATFNRRLLSPLLETWAAGKYWRSGLRLGVQSIVESIGLRDGLAITQFVR